MGAGAGTSPAEPELFCLVIQRTFRQLPNGRFSPNLVTKRSSLSRRGIRKVICENFNFRGHLPPKSDIEIRSNRHFTQSTVTECTAERYCLLHVVVQGPFPRSVNFFCTTYGCPIFGFWPIFPIEKPQNVPSGDQPPAQGLHRRMITIFPCGSRRSKGMPFGHGVFLRLLVGEETCPNFRLWQTAIPMHGMHTRRVRSEPKMSENAQF